MKRRRRKDAGEVWWVDEDGVTVRDENRLIAAVAAGLEDAEPENAPAHRSPSPARRAKSSRCPTQGLVGVRPEALALDLGHLATVPGSRAVTLLA